MSQKRDREPQPAFSDSPNTKPNKNQRLFSPLKPISEAVNENGKKHSNFQVQFIFFQRPQTQTVHPPSYPVLLKRLPRVSHYWRFDFFNPISFLDLIINQEEKLPKPTPIPFNPEVSSVAEVVNSKTGNNFKFLM